MSEMESAIVGVGSALSDVAMHQDRNASAMNRVADALELIAKEMKKARKANKKGKKR